MFLASVLHALSKLVVTVSPPAPLCLSRSKLGERKIWTGSNEMSLHRYSGKRARLVECATA
eukprot:5899123-Pleurochrysis_carterae.AAC.2